MLVLILVFVACCCGIPTYLGKPIWEQYPVSAVLPTEVADLSLRDDEAAEELTRQLEQEIRQAHPLAEGTFAGVYTDPVGKHVMIFGTTGFRADPAADAAAEISRLTGQYSVSDQQTMETGIRGVHQRCGIGQADGTSVVICTWADHGSLATALFDRRSMAESSALLADLRARLIIRG